MNKSNLKKINSDNEEKQRRKINLGRRK